MFMVMVKVKVMVVVMLMVIDNLHVYKDHRFLNKLFLTR
jgi:hypothetical protein